jgi:fumarate hydratase class II
MGEKQAMRTERDSMGVVQVPSEALYGGETQRALRHLGH